MAAAGRPRASLGGLALQEDRVLGLPRLRVMGARPLSPDHLDAVLLPGRERDALAALAGWLGRPDSAAAGLATLRRLHAERWGGRSRFLGGFDAFAAAARAGADRGEFVFHELTVGGETIAAMGSFEVAGRLSRYQAGRLTDHAWRRGSTLLLARIIEDACRRGLTEVDFLRGDHAYKRSFAPETREVLRLRAATGAAGHLALAALVLAGRLRRLAGGALRRVREPSAG